MSSVSPQMSCEVSGNSCSAVSYRRIYPEETDLLPQFVEVETAAHINPWNESACRGCFAPLYIMSGAFVGQRLVGVALTYSTVEINDLLTISVHPKYQGRGIGRGLLEFTLRQAAGSGSLECFLEVRCDNVRAMNLYASFGFCTVGMRKGYYANPDGSHSDAYTMHLRDIRAVLDAIRPTASALSGRSA